MRDDEERNAIRARWVLHAVPEKSVGVECGVWEWKGERRRRGKFGVRGGERDDGDGLCFWTFIISQLASENRGSDHLSTVTDAGKFYSGKAN